MFVSHLGVQQHEQSEDIVSDLHMPQHTQCTTGLVGSFFFFLFYPGFCPYHLISNIMCFNGVVCFYVQTQILSSVFQAKETIP